MPNIYTFLFFRSSIFSSSLQRAFLSNLILKIRLRSSYFFYMKGTNGWLNGCIVSKKAFFSFNSLGFNHYFLDNIKDKKILPSCNDLINFIKYTIGLPWLPFSNLVLEAEQKYFNFATAHSIIFFILSLVF